MKYIGSKNRISKDIAPILQKCIDNNQSQVYIEPFVGGANMIDKIKCNIKIGLDIHRELIALLTAVKLGYTPQTIYQRKNIIKLGYIKSNTLIIM